MLEAALAIPILAVSSKDFDHVARGYLYSLDAHDDVLGLGSVGSDVLHGRGSHLAGDERQVFGAVPSVVYGIGHHIVEGGSCPALYIYGLAIGVFGYHLHIKPRFGSNDRGGIVGSEQQIATLADNQQWIVGSGELAADGLGLIYAGIFEVATTARIDTTGSVRQE